MPRSDMAAKDAEYLLVENLVDKPHARIAGHMPAVRNAYSGGFLSAMLEGEKSEICQPCGIRLGGIYPEYPAGFFLFIALIVIAWEKEHYWFSKSEYIFI
jgi:hypothetical protein